MTINIASAEYDSNTKLKVVKNLEEIICYLTVSFCQSSLICFNYIIMSYNICSIGKHIVKYKKPKMLSLKSMECNSLCNLN